MNASVPFFYGVSSFALLVIPAAMTFRAIMTKMLQRNEDVAIGETDFDENLRKIESKRERESA